MLYHSFHFFTPYEIVQLTKCSTCLMLDSIDLRHTRLKTPGSSHCNKNFLDQLYSLRQRKEAGNFLFILVLKDTYFLFFAENLFFWMVLYFFFNIVNKKKSILWSRKPNFLTNSVNKLQCGIYLLSKSEEFYSILSSVGEHSKVMLFFQQNKILKQRWFEFFSLMQI